MRKLIEPALIHCIDQVIRQPSFDMNPMSFPLVRPEIIFKDPRTARPYSLSDGQNMYNRVVLVCTVNVYIPASLGGYLREYLAPTIGLAAYKIY